MKALDNNENNEILEENAENQDELVLDEDIELDKDMNTKVTEEYDASQIQVLEGLEAVRKRPGMYIGSTGPRGLHHLVYEIVDNSIDEALAGFCTNIDVEILPGNVISVKDNGRGIPVGMNEKMGISTVTVVLTSCTPAVSSAATATRSPAVCTASARPSSTPCPSGSKLKLRRTAMSISSASRTAVIPTMTSRR